MTDAMRMVVPPGYSPTRVVDDLCDMVMRVLFAAEAYGRLEEVLDTLGPQIEELRERG